jgi:hypothetical protein
MGQDLTFTARATLCHPILEQVNEPGSPCLALRCHIHGSTQELSNGDNDTSLEAILQCCREAPRNKQSWDGEDPRPAPLSPALLPSY